MYVATSTTNKPLIGPVLCGLRATRFRFADALETAEDPDLKWRCTMLTAVSLALRDSGDVEGSAARAATCLKHAEAFAIDEGELAQKAQGVLSEVYLIDLID